MAQAGMITGVPRSSPRRITHPHCTLSSDKEHLVFSLVTKFGSNRLRKLRHVGLVNVDLSS